MHLIPNFIWPDHLDVYGVILNLRNLKFSAGTKYALIKGRYEAAELYFVNKYVKNNDFVIELGASIGIVTRLISKKVGVLGNVIAIEGSKKVFNSEKSNLKNIDNIRYIHALGFPFYNVNLNKYKNLKFEDSSSFLGGQIGKNISYNNQNDIIDLTIIPDGYEDYGLIVDIEGSEQEILSDFALIDHRISYIIIELHPMIYGENTKIKILNKIINFGFYCSEFKNDVFVLLRK